jgi:hypothetical protein
MMEVGEKPGFQIFKMTTGQTTPADTPLDTPKSERQANEDYSISDLSIAEKQLQDLLNKRENLQKHLVWIVITRHRLKIACIIWKHHILMK